MSCEAALLSSCVRRLAWAFTSAADAAPVPVPFTSVMSTPISRARARTEGAAATSDGNFPVRGDTCGAQHRAQAGQFCSFSDSGITDSNARYRLRAGRAFPARLSVASLRRSAVPAESVRRSRFPRARFRPRFRHLRFGNRALHGEDRLPNLELLAFFHEHGLYRAFDGGRNLDGSFIGFEFQHRLIRDDFVARLNQQLHKSPAVTFSPIRGA